MRVNQVAKQLKISPSTVRKYANEGRIKHDLNPAGQRVFTQENIDEFLGIEKTKTIAFYVRSSSGNKELINSQIKELTETYGEPAFIYKDSASGLNENRPGLLKLFEDAENKKFTHLYVTYEDRLSRFGVTFIKKLLEKDDITLTILNQKVKYSIEQELMQDFMNLIASFSGKFYRLRSTENKQKLLDKAKSELKNE